MKIIIILTLLILGLYADTDFIDFKNNRNYFEDSQFKKQVGQCTWFVDGVIREQFGYDIEFIRPYGRYAKKWDKLLPYKLKKEPVFPSIAIWGGKYGHVAFVEHIDYRKDGNHIMYIREANYPLQNNRLDKYDGMLKMISYPRFRSRIRMFKGFLDLNEYK